MPSLIVNGAKIEYEDMGTGLPIILTPGGRSDMSTVRGLAKHLASAYRVIIYDRRNCGASDVVIAGDLSESDIWAEDLNEMLKQLGAYPAYVGGNSAGQRASLLLAIRHPEAVRGLLLWNITGGSVAAEQLGGRYLYNGDFLDIVRKYCLLGPVENCIEQLQKYIDAGARHIIFSISCPREDRARHIEIIAKELIPHFQSS